MNFFDHKNLGNHLLQLSPKVVKHPVCIYVCVCVCVLVGICFIYKHFTNSPPSNPQTVRVRRNATNVHLKPLNMSSYLATHHDRSLRCLCINAGLHLPEKRQQIIEESDIILKRVATQFLYLFATCNKGKGIESLWVPRFSALVQAGSGAHPTSYKRVTGLFFPGVKRPGRGLNHQSRSSAEIKDRLEL